MKTLDAIIIKKDESKHPLHVHLADSFWSRFNGLMGKKKDQTPGLLLTRTNQIHMFWMKFALDVYYLSPRGQVVRVQKNLKPWRVGPIVKEAVHVLEIPAGKDIGLEEGDTVLFE